jgi:hypothetical protein
MFSLLLLVVARTLHAQNETVLYNFAGSPDGSGPQSGLTFHDGHLYGWTGSAGEDGGGAVFAISPDGTGGWNENVIYSFCSVPGCTDRTSAVRAIAALCTNSTPRGQSG